jgi:hypothetical protein
MIHNASVASVIARAFMSDVCEVVTIKGKNGDPIRVNKTDYDRDQASDKPTMKLHTDDAEQSAAGTIMTNGYPDGVPHPVAAPAAPNFSAPDSADEPVVDPTKSAVAPTNPSSQQLMVAKEGTTKANTKFFVVRGDGTKLTGDEGVNGDGYGTEKDAWDAIMALPR